MSRPNVARRLAEHARDHGDRTALLEPGGARLTFAELERQTAAIAGGMRTRGLQPGDRLVLLAPMGIPLYLALIACFRSRVTVVLVDCFMVHSL